jgi:hypothetical protein
LGRPWVRSTLVEICDALCPHFQPWFSCLALIQLCCWPSSKHLAIASHFQSSNSLLKSASRQER